MKPPYRIITIVLGLVICLPCFAKKENNKNISKNDISLTITSDGPTKDEAIKNTLRTAVEQVYGVFVSENTGLLNDELVKDEIATVSSGNIKSYKEIAVSSDADRVTTTLEVVVSKGKLISYAKNKGAECELDGESLYRDIQLQKLYKQNEAKLFENLYKELYQLFLNGYDYKLDVKQVDNKYTGYRGVRSYGTYNPNLDPENNVCFECKITVRLNEQGEFAWNKLMSTLKSVGKSYNPNKLFGSDDDSREFPCLVSITKPANYYGSRDDYDKFKVRSAETCEYVSHLMDLLPSIIRNINIEYSGKSIDISKDLNYYEENYSDGALVRLNKTRPFSRKKGSICGEFRYYLNVPKDDLKGIKSLSIKSNDKFEDNNEMGLKRSIERSIEYYEYY